MDSKTDTDPKTPPAVPDAHTYLGAVARRVGWRMWWMPLIGLAVAWWGVAAGSFRYMALGFMLVLIVFPMIQTLAVVRYATLPSLAVRCRANEFHLGSDRVLTLKHSEVDPETGAVSDTLIEQATVERVEYRGKYAHLWVGKALHDFAIVPLWAVDQTVLASIEAQQNDFVE